MVQLHSEGPAGEGTVLSLGHPPDWRLSGPAAKTVSMPPENRSDRRKRVSQRALFDEVADLYDATRQSYPNEIVELIVRTAELTTGSSVLEIGCGTGQLTRRLAGRGLDITAIDIGPAMVAGAKRNVADPKVAFQVSSFEDFQPSQVFDLIVSATAFHWVDPDLGLAKAARTLRPSGWLALLTTGERYHEPLRSALRQLWTKYNPSQAKWAPGAPWAEPLRDTDLFGTVVEGTHEQPLELPARTVLGVECTRATYISFNGAAQQGFASDLEEVLGPHRPSCSSRRPTSPWPRCRRRASSCRRPDSRFSGYMKRLLAITELLPRGTFTRRPEREHLGPPACRLGASSSCVYALLGRLGCRGRRTPSSTRAALAWSTPLTLSGLEAHI